MGFGGGIEVLEFGFEFREKLFFDVIKDVFKEDEVERIEMQFCHGFFGGKGGGRDYVAEI